MVERRTRDRQDAGSSPRRSGGRILFSYDDVELNVELNVLGCRVDILGTN